MEKSAALLSLHNPSALARWSLGFVLVGLTVAGAGTTREVILWGAPTPYDLHPDLIGLHWTGWGSVVTSVGVTGLLGMLAQSRSRRVLDVSRWRAAGTLLNILYWLSCPALHVLLHDLWRSSYANPVLSAILKAYYIPHWRLYDFTSSVVFSPAHDKDSLWMWVGLYLPLLTMLTGAISAALAWLIATSPPVIQRIRTARTGSPVS